MTSNVAHTRLRAARSIRAYEERLRHIQVAETGFRIAPDAILVAALRARG
jgi:hypothetical protein